jgi:hypothetical protein
VFLQDTGMVGGCSLASGCVLWQKSTAETERWIEQTSGGEGSHYVDTAGILANTQDVKNKIRERENQEMKECFE